MSRLRLRGGSDIGAPPPPPSEIYGPVYGAQWVRDSCAPRAVTQPSGSVVTVAPGSNLTQGLLTANPGATFWLQKGTHTVSASLSPTANQRFYCESVAGKNRTSSDSAVITANGATLSGWIIGGSAAGIQIYGGVWTGLATVADTWRAAIGGNESTGSGWVVQDAIVGPNGSMGVRLFGPSWTVRRCYIHDNGFYGIATQSPSQSIRNAGALMEFCHLYRNSTQVHGTSVDAGQKFMRVDAMTCRYNYVQAQEGAGLWWDYNHIDHEIHDNVIEDCWDWGLFYEYSWGGADIHHNYLARNAEHYGTDSWFNAVQLLVSSTDGYADRSDPAASPRFREVRVRNNLLTGTSKQMGVLELAGRQHPRQIKFYDNKVIWTGSNPAMELAGAESNDTTDVYVNGNTFESNRYYATDTANARWQWQGTGIAGVSKTWAQWVAYGHDDPGGSFEEWTG